MKLNNQKIEDLLHRFGTLPPPIIDENSRIYTSGWKEGYQVAINNLEELGLLALTDNLRVTDDNGYVWITTQDVLDDSFNQRMGLVVAYTSIDGELTLSNFSAKAWRQGKIVYGCDATHE